MEFAVSDHSVNSSPAANPVFGPEVFRIYLVDLVDADLIITH
jgi:hypothetical protein